MSFIRLGEALAKMKEKIGDEFKPFDIEFIAFDRSRKTGGEIREYKKVIRCGQDHDMQRLQTIGIKPYDGTGHPIPVHIRLITRFNNLEVIY